MLVNWRVNGSTLRRNISPKANQASVSPHSIYHAFFKSESIILLYIASKKESVTISIRDVDDWYMFGISEGDSSLLSFPSWLFES